MLHDATTHIVDFLHDIVRMREPCASAQLIRNLERVRATCIRHPCMLRNPNRVRALDKTSPDLKKSIAHIRSNCVHLDKSHQAPRTM